MASTIDKAMVVEPTHKTGQAWRFCRVWAISVAVLVLAVGAFNAVIDPYLVIGSPRIAGLNAAKPETETHAQIAKDSLLARSRPVTVMIGSSKVEIGLAAESQAWPASYRPVFNDGVPGIGILGNLDDLRQALAIGTVRHVLVAIDLVDLMAPTPDPAKPASGPTWWPQRLKDVLLATFSIDALQASLVTIAAQQQSDPVDMTDAGSANEADFRHSFGQGGSIGLFLPKDTDNLRAMQRLAGRIAKDPVPEPRKWAAVSTIIALCRETGVDLVFVILPSHVDYYEAVVQTGLWPRHQAAIARLTRLIAQDGATKIRLWDFASYDPYSTEQVPSRIATPMKSFWEPNHFKRAIGDKVLSAIYQGTAGYGVLLMPANIDKYLADENARQARYRADHDGTLTRLARAAADVARDTR